ncbi:MAG: hypothetical protein KBD78_04815 [Oligoflexales bacterium]|nr:hypothetical protein [Oligoflexales bacterium]
MLVTSNLMQERSQLEKSFYAAFDVPLLRQDCELITKGKSHAHFEGAGRHFEVYKTSIRGFDFALCFPQEGFKKERLTGKKTWKELMNLLKAIKNPLIPPFEFLTIKDSQNLVLVQPFGLLKKKSNSDTSVSLGELIDKFQEQLKAQHLYLGDIPQIRYIGELPFIHDYSELHELSF